MPETHTFLAIFKDGRQQQFIAQTFELAKRWGNRTGAVEVYFRIYPNKPEKREDLEDDE